MARRRIEAVGDLLNNFIHDVGGIRSELIRLAVVEARDAVRVLSEVTNLNATAQGALNDFIRIAPAFEEPGPCGVVGLDEQTASALCDSDDRDSRLNHLRSLLSTALSSIGTNLTYQIGDAVLMF